ncbi:MAG: cytidylate kinase-like family protein [Verrucomicrobia bacterium]|nr:cytidylate kinase-like family protein [Verrucomicrobiota bacterium]
MVPHTYLEHGLSVLQARLRSPLRPSVPGVHTEIRPFITLSRETGAGATTLGRELIPFLNRQFGGDDTSWVFLDRDLLTHALTQHQLPERLAEYLPEDRISEIRSAIGELVGLHPSLWQLEQKVTETILQLAHVGHVIFAGRASHLITRNVPGGLHLRLVAARETRIPRIAALLRCTPELAAAHIDKNDAARRRFVRTHFGREIDDPHLYDLVLNTDYISTGTAVKLALAALRDRLDQAPAAAASLGPVCA